MAKGIFPSSEINNNTANKLTASQKKRKLVTLKVHFWNKTILEELVD